MEEAVLLLGRDAAVADLFTAAKAGHKGAVDWLAERQQYLAMAVTDIATIIAADIANASMRSRNSTVA